jgi:hypothetical protein
MPSRKPKSPDLNRASFAIVEEATRSAKVDSEKNPAAVALGRLGGQKGGPARARKLSPKRRAAIAKKAAIARWKSKRKPA